MSMFMCNRKSIIVCDLLRKTTISSQFLKIDLKGVVRGLIGSGERGKESCIGKGRFAPIGVFFKVAFGD